MFPISMLCSVGIHPAVPKRYASLFDANICLVMMSWRRNLVVSSCIPGELTARSSYTLCLTALHCPVGVHRAQHCAEHGEAHAAQSDSGFGSGAGQDPEREGGEGGPDAGRGGASEARAR